MTRPRALGGFIGISGWLPFVAELDTKDDVPNFLSDVAKNATEFSKTPALLAHSVDNYVIEVEHGRAARDKLQSLGLQPAYREYETGGHEIEETKGYQDIEDFLHSRISTESC
jgi:predicted esterase